MCHPSRPEELVGETSRTTGTTHVPGPLPHHQTFPVPADVEEPQGRHPLGPLQTEVPGEKGGEYLRPVKNRPYQAPVVHLLPQSVRQVAPVRVFVVSPTHVGKEVRRVPQGQRRHHPFPSPKLLLLVHHAPLRLILLLLVALPAHEVEPEDPSRIRVRDELRGLLGHQPLPLLPLSLPFRLPLGPHHHGPLGRQVDVVQFRPEEQKADLVAHHLLGLLLLLRPPLLLPPGGRRRRG